MSSLVKLDHSGMAEMLKSDKVANAVFELAEKVASAAGGDEAVLRHSIPVTVDEYETDRAAASVTLADPAGLAVEAKHGVLVKAAGTAGLEVTSRS